MSALTLAQAKSDLNITSVDAARDVKLQAEIDSAEATLADKVGPLSSTAITARVRVYGMGDTLVLPVLPVISLTSVTGVSGTAVTVGELHVDNEAGLVTYADGVRYFTEVQGLYDVVYQAGYSPLPADLLDAIKAVVRERWAPQRGAAGKPGSGTDSEAMTSGSESDYLSPRVLQMIEPYLEELGFA
jgi:hypothetical protein